MVVVDFDDVVGIVFVVVTVRVIGFGNELWGVVVIVVVVVVVGVGVVAV